MLAYSASIVLDFDDLEQIIKVCMAARDVSFQNLYYKREGHLLLDLCSIV